MHIISNHPFSRMPANRQRQWFFLLFVATLVVMIALQVIGAPLQTEAAPGGIVTFEFAGDVATARHIIESWQGATLASTGLSLGLDFLFLLLYGAAISMACVGLAERLMMRHSRFAALGVALAWGAWLASLLDAIENLALIRLLLGDFNAIWPPLAYGCAAVKFALVLAGLLYTLVGAILLRVERR